MCSMDEKEKANDYMFMFGKKKMYVKYDFQKYCFLWFSIDNKIG